MSDQAAGASLARGRALIDLGRNEEAASMLRDAASANPEDPEIRCHLALALLRGGEHAAALEATNGATSLAPDWEWPHRLRALALLGAGRSKKALDAARESARLAPGAAEPHQVEAQVCLQLGDLKGASASAERGLAIDPELAALHTVAGDVADAKDRPTEAAASYRRALALDPEDAVTHNNLGATLLRLDREDEAHAAFETAARLDPRFDLPRQNLAQSTRSSVNGWAGILFGSFFAFRAIGSFAAGKTEAGFVFLALLVALVTFAVWNSRRRARLLSPSAQAVLADQKWHEKIELKHWRPWIFLIPSPFYFALGALALGFVLADNGYNGWPLGRVLVVVALSAFVGFTGWRARRYLRFRGWWPGTG